MLFAPCFLLLLLCPHGETAADLPLPTDWQGTWKGTLELHGPTGKTGQVEIELRIEPIPGRAEWTWKTTYGQGPSSTVKDYKLVPVADKPGCFHMDEKNGILLDARLTGSVLHSQFRVADSFLTARYEIRGDNLIIEVTSASSQDKGDKKEPVQSFSVKSVQLATLKRVNK